MHAYIEAKKEELRMKYLRDTLENFDMNMVCKILRYGKPFFINFEQMRDPMNTYVLPIFIKPGRTHFMLRTAMDQQVKQRVDNGIKVNIQNY